MKEDFLNIINHYPEFKLSKFYKPRILLGSRYNECILQLVDLDSFDHLNSATICLIISKEESEQAKLKPLMSELIHKHEEVKFELDVSRSLFEHKIDPYFVPYLKNVKLDRAEMINCKIFPTDEKL
uniref:Uncharacterized protein n=1 Tax=Euplotes harpa TaxID=151035 RepID=A0A7S3JAD8_9SPIT|mmetsp:Transcript_2915/g.3590  ORF Transcript_2915/g.3590 Transcript_2915/m.3590 type:complete len:126 (+) Transcript_2915:151-528(+)